MLAPALDEEPPLLELCITDMKDPRFDPKDYTEYEIVLVRNRKNYVNAYWNLRSRHSFTRHQRRSLATHLRLFVSAGSAKGLAAADGELRRAATIGG